MSIDPTRREWLAGVAGSATLAVAQGGEPVTARRKPAFGFCLNTSTVRDRNGKSRPIVELIDIAAKAGYDAIEPWTSEIDEYLKSGGQLKELRKRIEDAGLKVRGRDRLRRVDRRGRGAAQEGAGTGEARHGLGRGDRRPAHRRPAGRRDRRHEQARRPEVHAAGDRPARRRGPLPGAAGTRQDDGRDADRRDLGLLEDAAPARRGAAASRPSAATARRASCRTFTTSTRAARTSPASACSRRNAIGIFHVNDYPKIDRDKITDADRVYPGDGIAPLKEVFAALREIGLRRVRVAGTVQPRLLEAGPARRSRRPAWRRRRPRRRSDVGNTCLT